jgi:hypothetical protein
MGKKNCPLRTSLGEEDPRESGKYCHIYDAAKVVTIGNHPPWFVYLMTHNERSSNFKCYTFIGISSNPFRKHMMHKVKALPNCKKTRPAAAHWVLAEAVGPFESYAHAEKVKDIWTHITRGENGRHIKGMDIVSMINGYSSTNHDEEGGDAETDERLLGLKNFAKKMNFSYVVRCFSRTVSEDIPLFLLKKLPPSMCKPSESEALTLESVLEHTFSSSFPSPGAAAYSSCLSHKGRGKKRKERITVDIHATHLRVPTPSPFEDSPFDPIHKQPSVAKRQRGAIVRGRSIKHVPVDASIGKIERIPPFHDGRIVHPSPFDDGPF